MKTATITLAALLLIGCGSGDEETQDYQDGGGFHGLPADSGVAQSPDSKSPPAGDATCEPGVTIIGGVPFGPAPPDVSNCKCGIGCVMKLAYDCKGYYCEQVCVECP